MTKNKKKKNQPEKDAITKKIEKLYQNYGIDVSEMDDEEFERLRSSYRNRGKDIDKDLESSEKFKDRFIDDIV